VILPVVTFIVFFLAILAAYWLFVVRLEQQSLGLLRRRMTPTQAVKASLQRGLVKQEQALSAVGVFESCCAAASSERGRSRR